MLAAFLLLALQGGPAPQGQWPPPLPQPLDPPPPSQLLAALGQTSAPWEQRLEALADLACQSGPLPLEPLLALRSHLPAAALPDYARCLGRTGAEALETLRKYADKKDPELQAEALYAIARLDPEQGASLARALLCAPDPPAAAQVAALRALADMDSPYAHVEALRHLDRAEGAFLLEILAVLRRRPDLEDAGYLIPVLERNSGLAANESVQLLRDLTGYRIGLDAKTWRYFLQQHKARGTPFRRAPEPGDQEPETLTYLGVPILSNRIVFVLDSSGSMNEELPEQRRQTRGGMAIEELSRLLPRLPAQARFDIVFFSDHAAAYSPPPGAGGDGLSPCAPDSLAAVDGWLHNHRFDGGTDIATALDLAFRHPTAEEIVLLSDGEPTVGEVRPYRILNQVERWNRWRNLRISTISLGAPPPARQFLYKLAQHGGTCRVLE